MANSFTHEIIKMEIFYLFIYLTFFFNLEFDSPSCGCRTDLILVIVNRDWAIFLLILPRTLDTAFRGQARPDLGVCILYVPQCVLEVCVFVCAAASS